MKKQSDEDSTDKNTINDRNLSKIRAFPVLIALGLILLVLFVYDSTIALGVAAVSILTFSQGFFVNDPNEARVIEFFGHYIGTYFKSGRLCCIASVG